jgi:DNA replication and repair protein RecF
LVCDVNPLEGEIVERFERLLRQRNATLRSWRGVSPSPNQRAELAIWSDDLAQAVEPLVESRERLLSDLEPGVGRHYEHLAERQERISVSYERSWDGPFREALERSLDDDVARGFTTIGPHRDDMVVTLNGRDARRQASQGEQRSLALALRLAGHELVSTARHISPLLLLDDVFSELDPLRSERLLTLLPVGQTLVTTATPLPAGMSPAVIFDLATLIS